MQSNIDQDSEVLWEVRWRRSATKKT